MTEQKSEEELIKKLTDLKYIYRSDIRDRVSLEKNFRQKFEDLNLVHLTDTEFARLLEEIVVPDVFTAARALRERNSFEREDGTPLFYTLVNIKDWCKNTFEVVNQLRINTDNSHHRYDVILLINGVPVVQIELKTLAISPRRAMQQIVDYKNHPGNGYSKTLLCFLQLFVVSNRSETWYFANNNSTHFSFDADERFLPLYQFAGEDNKGSVACKPITCREPSRLWPFISQGGGADGTQPATIIAPVVQESAGLLPFVPSRTGGRFAN
jgi:type I restriction enzyme R subunit